MPDMKPYTHKVQYYETDKMGIVHHSNYLRWFESARIDFLEQLGVPFDTLEARGLASPVLTASAQYRTPAKIGETVEIAVELAEFKGGRFRFSYTVRDADSGEVRALGETSHCFIKDGIPAALRRADVELYERIGNYMENRERNESKLGMDAIYGLE